MVFEGPAFTTDPPRPGPLNGLIITTNNGDDTLSAFDPALGRVRWTLPIGFIPVELEGPHHVVAAPNGEFLYVNLSETVVGSGTGPHGAHGTGLQPGYTLKLRTDDGTVVAATRVDPNPGDLTLSRDGATLYVTHYDLIKWTAAATAGDLRLGDANLVVIDTANMTIRARVPLCPAPHGVRLSIDGRWLYTTCGPDEIAVVELGNLRDGARRVPLPGALETPSCDRCPYALAVAPDESVWVSSLGPNGGGSGRGGIDVYDPTRRTFDPNRRATLCGRAVFAAFAPAADGYTVYIPEQGCGDAVARYGPDVAPLGRIALAAADCVNAHMMLLAPTGATGWLLCEGDHHGLGSLMTLDLATQSVRATAPLGVFPDGAALVP